MVAVDELIQSAGGVAHAAIASDNSRVVWMRERMISSRLAGPYRQFTLLPAMLMSRAPSSSAVIAAVSPHAASFPVRPMMLTVEPSARNARTR
ncbi:MAG: hypothetical protein JWP19_918 [Rhodoglobus sp.]|nr:hypothetical protein [Rhodoglobus sp.]